MKSLPYRYLQNKILSEDNDIQNFKKEPKNRLIEN